MPGNSNTFPVLRAGVPDNAKNMSAAQADADCKLVSIQPTSWSGKGMRNARKSIGKAADRIHRFPINRKPPVQTKHTKEEMISAVRLFSDVWLAAGIENRMSAATPATAGSAAH